MLKEYFEDTILHQKRRSSEYRLTEQDITNFIKKWDTQTVSADTGNTANNKLAGLTASSIHLVAIFGKLFNQRKPSPAFVAGLSLDKLQFFNYAGPDDILVLETEAITKRESKTDPNVGIIRYYCRLLNQNDETLVTGEPSGLVEKRVRY